MSALTSRPGDARPWCRRERSMVVTGRARRGGRNSQHVPHRPGRSRAMLVATRIQRHSLPCYRHCAAGADATIRARRSRRVAQGAALLPPIESTKSLGTAISTDHGFRSDQEGQVRHRLVIVQQHHFLAANAKPFRVMLQPVEAFSKPDVLQAGSHLAEYETGSNH